MRLNTLFLFLLTSVLVGCTSERADDDDGSVCVSGETQVCVCPGSAEGAQACNEDGDGWETCQCPGDDDDAGPNDDDAGPNDDDIGPNDDDIGPNDDDAGPNDDDAGPNDDDAGPNDDDAGPNDDDSDHDDDDTFPPNDDDTGPPDDDDAGPNDDDLGPPDDDDLGPPDDDDGGPNDDDAVDTGPTPCPGGDQTICDDPSNCPLPGGCNCVDNAVLGDWFCFPACPGGQPDCDALGLGLVCTGGACQP